MLDHGDEVKVFDTATTTTTTYNGVSIDWSAPAQGVAANQRVGDAIDLIALEVRCSADAVAAGGLVRMIICQSAEPSGSFGVGTVLAGAGAATAPHSPYNLTGVRQEDFAVLYDKTWRTGTAIDDARHIIIPLKTRIQFDAGATSGTGKIYGIVISQLAAGGPVVYTYARLLYSDA